MSAHKDGCEHCGATLYSGPPDCPRCGAPVCCPQCCKIDTLERNNEALRKLLVDARDDVAECAGRESKPHRIKAYQEQLAAIDAAIKEQAK